MATYTDNNNTIALQDLKGPQGPAGSTGPVGATGSAGDQGLTGGQGPPNLIRTDITFSGRTTPCRRIKEGAFRFVGSCGFDKQAELIASGSTDIKVLLRGFTQPGSPTEIGLALNTNIPASDGNTILASTTTTVSGSGIEADTTIVSLTLTSSAFISQEDTLSLWAYIKPTHQEMEDTLAYLSNLVDADTGLSIYTNDQITAYKEQFYEYPYRMTTSNLWLTLKNDYDIINEGINDVIKTAYLAQEAAEAIHFAEIPGGPIVYNEQVQGKLNVYYLQIL